MSQIFDKNELFLEPKTTQYGSHMVMTNVHKPLKRKYVNIDTKFRDEYNYNQTTNYNITLPERITDVRTLTITSIELPMSFYNISSSLGNNSFNVIYYGATNSSSDDVTYNIVIPDGEYDAASLKTAITTKINMVGTGSADLVYDISNNKSQFYTKNGSPSTFQIDFTVNDISVPDKYNLKSKLGWILGYRKPTYEINTSKPTSEFSIDLNGPRYLYLAIEEFNKGNQNSFISPIAGSFINKNIVARITLDKHNYGFGSVLPVNKLNGLLISDVRSYTGKIDLMKLNVQILNDIGNPLSLNGYDFSFCLEIDHD